VLISVKELYEFWKVRPSGVVHVGAHAAEELEQYEIFGFGPVAWVEAQPLLASELKKRIKPPSVVIEALIWDTSGQQMALKLTNNSQSTSVFDFGTHEIDYPDIRVVGEISLTTVRLDEILPQGFTHSFLNIDIQGAEYQALKSLGKVIGNFQYIYLEVNNDQVYRGIQQVAEIDGLLGESGFVRVATIWTTASWGDAFYINRDLAESLFGGRVGLNLKVLIFRIWKSRLFNNILVHGLLRVLRRAVG
jgi:FkbM family methyltransferase